MADIPDDVRATIAWTIRHLGQGMTPEELAETIVTNPRLADILADRAARPAAEVVVKPLEWRPSHFGKYRRFEATVKFATFKYGSRPDGTAWHQAGDDYVEHQSEQEAKAAVEEAYAKMLREWGEQMGILSEEMGIIATPPDAAALVAAERERCAQLEATLKIADQTIGAMANSLNRQNPVNLPGADEQQWWAAHDAYRNKWLSARAAIRGGAE